MRTEVDLLENYPRTKRDLDTRCQKTEEDRAIARKFEREFFDGDRKHGYGGFSYNPRFWQPVVPVFQKYYKLTSKSTLLDVGCAKGFMLHDFSILIPGMSVFGIDISNYAIESAIETVKQNLSVADARDLPYQDNSFDLVISINTVHNFDRDGCIQSLKELERVSRKDKFIVVDAYRNEEERVRMENWNLTARTILHRDKWIELFDEAGYTGDYFWFIP